MQKSQLPHKQREHNRTTAMLVAVVLSFALSELPQGILVFISSVDKWYFQHVYIYLGDLFDIIVLLNTSVNFIMYASMSQRFRHMFAAKILIPVRDFLCYSWIVKTVPVSHEAQIPLRNQAGSDGDAGTCEFWLFPLTC